jgi:hypothetical protein
VQDRKALEKEEEKLLNMDEHIGRYVGHGRYCMRPLYTTYWFEPDLCIDRLCPRLLAW